MTVSPGRLGLEFLCKGMGKKAPVVVFDERQYGLKRRTESGMEQRHTSASLPGASKAPSKSFADLDVLKDLEISSLMERIQKSVDRVAEEGMDGRERRKHMQDNFRRLAGVVEKNKAAFKIRMGMLVKAKERARKQKQMIRESDAVVAKAHNLSRKLKRKGNRK